MVNAVLSLLLAHWVADFVLQTHWMATNKSKNWEALGAHVSIYTLALGVIMAAALMLIPMPGIAGISVVTFLSWLAFNGAAHFVTDAFTSRWTAKLWAKNDYHNFFVVIGFDQLIHAVTLISSLAFVIS